MAPSHTLPSPRSPADRDVVPPARRHRLLGAGALGLILVACVLVLVRGGSGYEVTMQVVDAGQLIKGNEVRIGAAPVGSVTGIGLADDGRAELRLAIDEGTAPLPEGTVARIRVDSLSGVANRTVALELPPRTGDGDGATIPDGGVIPARDTQAPVDLDALLASFDAETREGLATLVTGSAQQIDGRSDEAREALDALGPALGGMTDVAEAFARDEAELAALLREGATATSTLAARRADLTSFVSRAREATGAIAAEQTALAGALDRFPDVLERGTATFTGLRTTLDALDPLVADTARVTDDLPGFFSDLRGLARTGAAPLATLADTVRRPGGADDDLIDLLDRAPALERRTRTGFPRAIRTMDASRTQVTSLRQYTPDVVAAFAGVGQVTANYDANGHYARLQPGLLAFDHDAARNTLEPRGAGNPLDRLLSGAAAAIRCPGEALGAVADGSAPLRVPSCLLRPTAEG